MSVEQQQRFPSEISRLYSDVHARLTLSEAASMDDIVWNPALYTLLQPRDLSNECDRGDSPARLIYEFVTETHEEAAIVPNNELTISVAPKAKGGGGGSWRRGKHLSIWQHSIAHHG